MINIVDEIKREINDLEGRLKEIQEECSHPKVSLKIEYRSNTGNYDPSSNCYWTDYHCKLCGKRWTVMDE